MTSTIKEGQEIFVLFGIFIMGVLFSAVGWVNARVAIDECKMLGSVRLKLELFTHSIISGLVSVTILTYLVIHKDFNIYFGGSVAVLASVVSDSIISRIRGELKK
jgi:hypothetical protein